VICVVDASVAVKWFIGETPAAAHEDDVEQALDLLQACADGRVELLQPPHFLAEVGAVLARLTPATAARQLERLMALEITWAGPTAAHLKAVELGITLNHHLFDTLYHALALSVPGAVMVTADRRYFDKARSLGSITWLADFDPA
jgi:predicted nucleic acid-binding protein